MAGQTVPAGCGHVPPEHLAILNLCLARSNHRLVWGKPSRHPPLGTLQQRREQPDDLLAELLVPRPGYPVLQGHLV